MLHTVIGPGDGSSLKAGPTLREIRRHTRQAEVLKRYPFCSRDSNLSPFQKEPREKLGVKGHWFVLGGLGNRKNTTDHGELPFLPMSKPQIGKHKIPVSAPLRRAGGQTLLPFVLSI